MHSLTALQQSFPCFSFPSLLTNSASSWAFFFVVPVCLWFVGEVLFAGRDLVHLLFSQFLFLNSFQLKGYLKVFVASLCYWLWKGISSICCHRSIIAYHQHLFFFCNFLFFFCATSWATVYKARIYYYLCNATTILYWFVLESQCFSMNKVWNTLPGCCLLSQHTLV